MFLLPSIDIKQGKCVRLFQGDFDKETKYIESPLDIAIKYRSLGASWIHIVDLDGAYTGNLSNLNIIESIKTKTGINIQLGGGIRNIDSIKNALEVVDRVVIGSKSVDEPEIVTSWLDQFGAESIVLALDIRLDSQSNPIVASEGWTKTSGLSLWEAIENYNKDLIKYVLCTDISKDGALSGPNIKLYRKCVEYWPSIKFQASGGVRNINDIEILKKTGVYQAISGKALLEGKINNMEIKKFLLKE
jgi:phosphoribosylformimino-5-aminoimidazole carboxamide ribotide isomerase|tara:strand:- start:5750 stop:6487 length:738 start_codon:yes stop_codon:yes gene_type:complete